MTTGKVGPRSKYTPQCHEDIVEASELGASMKDAAACGGISLGTFMRWLADGRETPDSRYRQLYDDVIRARGKGCRDALRQLKALRASDNEKVKLEAVKFTVGSVHGYNKQRVEVQISSGVDEMTEVEDLLKLIKIGGETAAALEDVDDDEPEEGEE